MKKNTMLISIGVALTDYLNGCDKERELEKTMREGAETSKQMAGTNRPIPVPNLEPDNPQPKRKE
jgi:hypothetical protein